MVFADRRPDKWTSSYGSHHFMGLCRTRIIPVCHHIRLRKPACREICWSLCGGQCRRNWFAVLFFTCQHCPQRTCAVLWATATAVTLVGLRAASASSQGRGVTFCGNATYRQSLLRRGLGSARRYRSPPLLILPDPLFLPACMHPWCQSKPGRKMPRRLELTTISPQPSRSRSADRPNARRSLLRRLSSLLLCHSTICRSTAAICSSSTSI